MIRNKIFHKKTRRGNIVKIIQEHYLRDDIYCGLSICKFCTTASSRQRTLSSGQEITGLIADRLEKPSITNVVRSPHVLVVDTNVVLHQMDILEDDFIANHNSGNVIIPQTVVEEVKHRSPPAYKKLRDLLTNAQKGFYCFYNEFHLETFLEKLKNESSNDRNDRAIRKVAQWYASHLKKLKLETECVLLTDDRANAEKAKADDIQCFSVGDYVAGLGNRPDLLDKLASHGQKTDEKIMIAKGKTLFPEHLSLSELKIGLKSGHYFQGSFQASRENYLEGSVYLDAKSKHREIFVQGLLNINRAIHNDSVVVELLSEDQWSCPMSVLKLHELEADQGDDLEADDVELVYHYSFQDATAPAAKRAKKPELLPTGKVVGILKRNWRPCCGVLDLSPIEGATRHLFVAAERRLPRIRIETRQSSMLTGQRIVVCIDSWPRDSRYPKGHLVKALGPLGDKTTETDVVLLEHDIPHDNFSESVLACLPEMPWTITKKDYEERFDLRHLNICSIDPPGCTDIDDALHCRQLDDKTFEVGVHIADVSHFVKPGTAMDLEASKRGTTVYLVKERIDMLPELLSGNLCSLRSNVERFAFSVICQMTDEGEIISTKFGKSVIQSKVSFTYAQAQMRIDDPNQNDELTLSLRLVANIPKV
uniref:Protein DIS3 homolog n=1 Tax=Romanomermis culicivorax TaxID=13658 RepID=A0A915JGH6_ROMCU